jgi:hypothetical protein
MTVFLTFTSFWVSIPRFLLPVYPLFLLMGRVRPVVAQVAMFAVSIGLLGLFAAAFATNHWAF